MSLQAIRTDLGRNPMTDEKRARSGLWNRAYQVGVVVRDLDRAKAFYERLGVGPFEEGPSAHTLERRIYGKSAPDAAVRGALAKMGDFEFELLQPVSGNTIQGEFLERHGEGVVHICAFTDDIDRDIAELSDLGYEVISEGWLDDGGHFAYFDTREVGGLVLELFETGSDWT
jgi:catechol 2,3-dioxygenase-like lactoylglutathione lyase family enzyme